MRLSPKEVKAIVDVFRPYLEPVSGELFLFGSRADDSKLGGDIDLLVVVDGALRETLRDQTVRIRDQIHQRIGEQRIDITFTSREGMREDPFLRTISGVKLFPTDE